MEDNKIKVRHSGDHHHASFTVDSQSGKVIGGLLQNFSNNSSVTLSIDENSKINGDIIHSGKTHSFCVNIKSDGAFEGVYFDKSEDIELHISGSKTVLKSGKIPLGGLVLNGEHHKAEINLGTDGKISGVVESRLTKESQFRLEVKNEKVITGLFTHTGKNHQTAISFGQSGWNTEITGGTGDSRWSISAEHGLAQSKISGDIKVKF
jgi:hypothetical protein